MCTYLDASSEEVVRRLCHVWSLATVFRAGGLMGRGHEGSRRKVWDHRHECCCRTTEVGGGLVRQWVAIPGLLLLLLLLKLRGREKEGMKTLLHVRSQSDVIHMLSKEYCHALQNNF